MNVTIHGAVYVLRSELDVWRLVRSLRTLEALAAGKAA